MLGQCVSLSKSVCYCVEGEPRFKSSCLRCRLWDKFFGASGVSQEQVRAALGPFSRKAATKEARRYRIAQILVWISG